MTKRIFKQMAFFAAMLGFFSTQMFAQNMEIIGTGTIETNYPPNTQVFEYGWSSMLYTNDEMGASKSISKIAFDQTTDYGGYWEYAVLENQKIYVKQADLSGFSSLAYEDPENSANGYTLVFDGTVQFNLGWTELELMNSIEYDGSSALIVHWENHRGTSAPVVNVKFNASSVSGNLFKALGGDGSFPTAFGTYINDRPNLAVYFNGEGPANPVNPTPANNSFKGLVDTDLEFIIGDNTTSYDVYIGTTNPPSELLIADVAVSSPGAYSCNPSEILGNLQDAYTQYYWQVVANDGANTSPSEIWNYTTQGVIEDFPYFTSFEDLPLRTQYADTVDWNWPLVGSVNWHMVDYNTHSDTAAIACNVWGEYIGSYSLTSPRIYLPENYRTNFWWMLNNGDLENLNVFFEITADGGQNWELLKQFQPAEPMVEYEQALINLSAYAGNNVYFRWRYEALEFYIAEYFFLDDLTIEPAPDGAVIQVEEPIVTFPELAVGAETYLPLEVSNIGSIDLVITGSNMTAPFSFDLPAAIPAGGSAIVDVYMTATAQGNFDQNIEFTGEFDGQAVVQLLGSVYQSSYDFFENADLSLDLPENWHVIRTLDPYDIYTNVAIEQSNYDAYSAPNAFRMLKMNDTISPLMLVTEGVGGFNSNTLTFYAKKNLNDFEAQLSVGITSDPLFADSFEAIETFDMTPEYQLFTVEFPNSNTKPYIAFKFEGGNFATSIWLDDISWDVMGNYPPYCPNLLFPAANSTDVDVMTSLELKWTSAGGNPTGYKLSLGTNPEANNILDNVDLGDVLTYTFQNAPAYGQEYYWHVVAYNNYGEATGCGTNSFTTMSNPVVNVPFSENFDQIDAFGDREYPLGWSVENANNDNFPWDLISNIAAPGVAHSAPNAMHMLFSLTEMDDYLFTPPVYLSAGVNYELSFWYRTMGDAWVPNPSERMKVLIGSDNSGAGMIWELWNNTNITNLEWTEANVSFTVDNSGEHFLSFYAYSIANQGLLLLDDVAVDLYTGVKDNSVNNSLSFYPNPAKGNIQIVAEDEVKEVKIFSIDGKVVFQNSYNESNISLGLENLNNGVYMILISTENEVIREKLIIR